MKKRRKLAEICEEVERIINEKPTEEELQELFEILVKLGLAEYVEKASDQCN